MRSVIVTVYVLLTTAVLLAFCLGFAWIQG